MWTHPQTLVVPIRNHLVFLISVLSCLSRAHAEFNDPPAINVHPDHDSVALGDASIDSIVADGRSLFSTVFNTADGACRPYATGDSKPTLRPSAGPDFQRIAGPDASSCADCHNHPLQGGSGGIATNVFVGAHKTSPVTNTIEAEITSERNTTSVFGAGYIEMLAYEMTTDLQATREQALLDAERSGKSIRVQLASKGVTFGHIVAYPSGTYSAEEITGIDMDLVVKPFGAKGVAVSLREFTNFALNQHDGIQSEERFGWVRTGITDFDGDGVVEEFSIGQLSALTLYQASLPPPSRINPAAPKARADVRSGEITFERIGCALCHVTRLPLRSAWFLEPNPYNRPGSAVPGDVVGQIPLPLRAEPESGVVRADNGEVFVLAFTDLKRHRICDGNDLFFCNERVVQDFVPTDQFMTAKLWDAGTSAPYGHQGNLTTLTEAISHHSAEARDSRDKFVSLSVKEKSEMISFLKTLQAPSESE